MPRPCRFTSGKKTGADSRGGSVGSRDGLDRCGKVSPVPEFDPWTGQPVESRYIDWAIVVTEVIHSLGKATFKTPATIYMAVSVTMVSNLVDEWQVNELRRWRSSLLGHVTGLLQAPQLTAGVLLPQSVRGKSKAVPLQAWTGPEGSRRLRLPDFKTIGTWRWWGCQPYAPANFTPRKYSWYSFLLQAESTPRPYSMKPSGIEPATFRRVPRCLS